MRDLMVQGTFAFGVLALALLGLAGMFEANHAVTRLAVVAAGLSYLSQLSGSFLFDYPNSRLLLIVNWLGWISAVTCYALGFVILLGA